MIGQVLDGKYRIERQLGKGGMGTVYLATHLGTERPVAVKVIAPQFMERPEFVERFRREARAAGRLRHPNVVDVTDFGFCETCIGKVAYLAMEYLDGCTLGEILDEEKNLPVGWTLDIMEQVCSAVHEAHRQGIIHRDLKPDNIWLEPNQRGGYTVKVLDFGIAKLETPNSDTGEFSADNEISKEVVNLTSSGAAAATLIHDSISPTLISESVTAVHASASAALIVSDEKETAIMETEIVGDHVDDKSGTRSIESIGNYQPSLDSNSLASGSTLATRDLTRVGAVLGTPLYMSPEQCRGEKLDARSDIYSLGVIAYQMLSGRTPFSGDFTTVMEAHKEKEVPPLTARKVRRKLKAVIMAALAKDPALRPQSAEAFATKLRSRSEGIFGLLRRAGMIYTEHIAKFLTLSAFFHVPMIVLTTLIVALSILRVTGQITETTQNAFSAPLGILLFFVTALGAYLIIGTTTWIVSQSLAVPLRPIRLRTALRASARKWKRFLGTGVLTTIAQFSVGGILAAVLAGIFILVAVLIFGGTPVAISVAGAIGVLLGLLGFLLTNVLTTLVGPVVMMENLKGIAAIKRSIQLVRRSLVTSIAAVLIMFLIPAVVAGVLSAAINLSVRAIDNSAQNVTVQQNEDGTKFSVGDGESDRAVEFSISSGRGIRFTDMDPDTRKRVRSVVSETILQAFLLPMQMLMTSFTSIIVALLYLKTRQSGGEPLQELLSNFEDSEQPRKKWQERVRQRLLESGRISANT